LLIPGILCGLGAAFFQSVTYVLSRIYVTREGNSSTQLFVLSHVLTGVLGLLALPILYTEACPPLGVYVVPMVTAALSYLLAQAALFKTLHRVEASRVSPMLGLKILILAVITVLFIEDAVTPLQWAGVLLTVAAAFVLNYSGGGIPLAAIFGILLCCLGYCISDLSIKILMDRLDSLSPIRRGPFGVAVTYVFNGIICAGILAFMKARPSRRQWRQALPVAFAWILAMTCLFSCFKFIGVLPGNIVQSTRGIMSILLGGVVARAGHVHLERKLEKGVLVRRLVAAIFMAAAIVLFLYEQLVGA